MELEAVVPTLVELVALVALVAVEALPVKAPTKVVAVTVLVLGLYVAGPTFIAWLDVELAGNKAK